MTAGTPDADVARATDLDGLVALVLGLIENPSTAALADAPFPVAAFSGPELRLAAASRAWRALFDDQAPANVRRLLASTRRSRRLASDRVQFAPHPGAFVRTCLFAAGPLRDGVVAACTDLTDIVVADRLAAPAAALVWSGRDGEGDWANAVFRAYTGRAASVWQGAIHVEDIAELARALRSSTRPPGEIRIADAAGRFRPHSLRLSHDSARWYALALDHDARPSQLEQLQRGLRASERANATKDRLLVTVSHELRTPLTTIALWERVAREHLRDQALLGRALDAIRDSAKLQARLVEDLLDVSRAIEGRLALERKRLNIAEVVGAAVDGARPAAEAVGIALTASFDVDPVRVDADPQRLRQVFDNLLSNAIDSTPTGGSIDVACRRNGREVAVAIRDNGNGIAPDVLPELFVPGATIGDNAHQSGRRRGLGVGLAIAHQIVQLHEGTIAAASEGIGRGATFTVTLPVVRDSARTVVGPPRVPRLDGTTVLLVDDDAHVRDALHRVLTALGAEVTSAPSARDARAVIERALPDVVLCDLAMPVEDGYSFVRWMRAAPGALGGVATLAVTASVGDRDRRRCAEAGFDAHLAKPVDLPKLARSIRKAIARRRSPTQPSP